MSRAVLKIENLTVVDSCTNKVLLKDISFDVERKEVVAIIGESGQGKTLLVNSIASILNRNLKIRKGNILFDSQSSGYYLNLLGKKSDIERYKNFSRGIEITFIFQDPSLYLHPNLTLLEQLELFLSEVLIDSSIDSRTSIYIEQMKKVGFQNPETFLDKKTAELSGGEKQLLSLTILLLKKPSLIVADEPMSSMDHMSSYEIIRILKDYCKENDASLIWITHNLALALKFSDKIGYIDKGILEWFGSRREFSLPSNTNEKIRSILESFNKYNDFSIWKNPITTVEEKKGRVLLSSSNICKKDSHSQKVILDDVSLEIREGESIALVGSLGSGKSSLIKVLAGLDRDYTGVVLLEGRDIRKLSQESITEFCQNIPQNSFEVLNNKLTIWQIFLELSLISKERNFLDCFRKVISKEEKIKLLEKIEEIFSCVGLSLDVLNKTPIELSGGMLQRVSIAKSLFSSRKIKILYCDEINSALDTFNKIKLYSLLEGLSKEFTLVLITHDLNFLKLARRVIVMKDAKIKEDIQMVNVAREAKSDLLRRFIDSWQRG